VDDSLFLGKIGVVIVVVAVVGSTIFGASSLGSSFSFVVGSFVIRFGGSLSAEVGVVLISPSFISRLLLLLLLFPLDLQKAIGTIAGTACNGTGNSGRRCLCCCSAALFEDITHARFLRRHGELDWLGFVCLIFALDRFDWDDIIMFG